MNNPYAIGILLIGFIIGLILMWIIED